MNKHEELEIKIKEAVKTASKEELQSAMKLIEDYLGESKDQILNNLIGTKTE